MAEGLSRPASVELNVQRKLRALIEEEIQKRHLNTKGLAKRLDLLPSGAQALMERKTWSIETTLRVAERLNIQMNIELKSTK